MLCPLRKVVKNYEYPDKDIREVVEFQDCIEAECAWWNLEDKQCSIHRIACDTGKVRYWIERLKMKIGF